MTIFFTILFVLFLLSLVAIGVIIYRIYSAIHKLKRKFGFDDTSSQASSRRKKRRRSANRYGRRGRIIPPEYAVDVDYEILELTGKECFVRIEDVLSGRGEPQISDVEYKVVMISQ